MVAVSMPDGTFWKIAWHAKRPLMESFLTRNYGTAKLYLRPAIQYDFI